MARSKLSHQLGTRLREARAEAGLTLRGLAEAARVGSSTINDIEKGHHVPAADTVESLAEALGVSPCWLAYGIGRKKVRPAPRDRAADGAEAK